MIVYRSVEELQSSTPDHAGPVVVTTGFLDGLHLGHQGLLDDLKGWATEVEGTPAVITFARHPQLALSGSGPPVIHSLEHRLLLLKRAGIQACLVLEFTRELASWSPEDFVRHILVEGFGSRRLLLGFDSAIGHRRLGTFPYLSARSDELGLEVRQSEPRILDGQRVSSTLVREAVFRGELARIRELTGRDHALLGQVVHGDHRGRELGFPTANLEVEVEATLPGGVYFARAFCPRGVMPLEPRPALVNIGRRPTFESRDPPAAGEFVRFDPRTDRIEAHLLDFSGDLYGRTLEVIFHERHRDEIRFSGPEALVEQIRSDESAFRSWLEGQDGIAGD